MDILDIKEKFGKKYDYALREMLIYAKNKGIITESERVTLARLI